MKRRLAMGTSGIFCLVALGFADPSPESSFTISSHANIYGAGLPEGSAMPSPSGGGGGGPPVSVPIRDGKKRVITFTKATGTVDFGNASAPTGPDGGNFSYRIGGHRGLSGFRAPVVGCLVGVFLEKDGPGSEVPPTIDFNTRGLNFTSLSPQIGQVFFVGDGINEAGLQQQFLVPPTATCLYLGFADSYYSGAGPGYYSDNSGKVTITVQAKSTDLEFPSVP